MNKSKNPIIIWLFIGAFLVVSMVVIGGITRLTQSGLSMVEWKLLMGSVPPLNDTEWQEVFDQYKSSPEYKIVNNQFSLEDFKSIFWWEYIHRVLGRLIGLVFLIPFVIFIIQKRIDKSLGKKLFLIFLLGAFQGFLGWFMVKSGLVEDPHVSHYRLAAHLIAALTLFCLIIWVAFDLIYKDYKEPVDSQVLSNVRKWTLTGLVVLWVQIIYGAFVAGLKAGLYYNTWPKMGIKWVPTEVGEAISRDGPMAFLNNITLVQFVHRYVGWVVAFIVVYLIFYIRKITVGKNLQWASLYLLLITLTQILLGIFTLIYQVPVWLGVVHQLGAVFLLGGFIYVLHRTSNIQMGMTS